MHEWKLKRAEFFAGVRCELANPNSKEAERASKVHSGVELRSEGIHLRTRPLHPLPASVPVCSYDESWLRALRTAMQLGGLRTTKILILARKPPPCPEPALPRPLALRVQSCRRSQGSPPSAFSMLLASLPLRTLSSPFPVDNDCFSLVLYSQVLPISKVGF